MKSLLIILISTILTGYSGSNSVILITGTVYNSSGKTPLSAVKIAVKGTSVETSTDVNGQYKININSDNDFLIATAVGYAKQEIYVGSKRVVDFFLVANYLALDEDEVKQNVSIPGQLSEKRKVISTEQLGVARPQHYQSPVHAYAQEPYLQHNTEEYESIEENMFHDPNRKPLSTFSIDVDAASYSNIRRFLRQGQQPPKDAVRIEEMVNYFNYNYPQPEAEYPFSIYTELSEAPWNDQHQLLHIGLQGKDIPTDNLPPSNLVFLIDVSGSMNSPNKLGLLKSAFKLLINQLRDRDKVSIVVYAGAAGVVLQPTPGDHRQTIIDALAQLQAGGSTAGGEGIKLAYKIAQEQFVAEGNNRVILATDGDFNVGASSNAEMERLIEKEREKGVFLTVLGFGMGNYKDSKMEILADKGNGNYAYIDDIMEAKKVLVNEFGGTLFTIAKDVKLQIEFNPSHVKAYRLIGYENRKLRDEDFNNDKKDAGELGSGHTVTALYEIITHEGNVGSAYIRGIDPLKYQQGKLVNSKDHLEELMTLKLRYKHPEGTRSHLVSTVVSNVPKPYLGTSDNFRWSAAVASFGMLLRASEFKGNSTYALVEKWAKSAQGSDPQGYRAEFIKMVQSVDLLAQK